MSDLSAQPVLIQTLYTQYREGILVVNRNYQRKLVWTLEEKQKLIDSILHGYPIPLILIAETRWDSESKLEIMDGLQRLHTIVSFIENAFSTFDGKCFDVGQSARAKIAHDEGSFNVDPATEKLTAEQSAKILEYSVPISIIRNADDNTITEVFGRINSYGHRLSDQERRQAGLISPYSKLVRKLAAELRGDVSGDNLLLSDMPTISVDLSMTKLGYGVQAEEIFWVEHGILRSTDLRDSVDEQIIADICACILADELIPRTRDALDSVYNPESEEYASISTRLEEYDADKLVIEFKYCVELIAQIVLESDQSKLRNIVFTNNTTNAYPTIFSTILLAIHELLFGAGLVVSDKGALAKGLKNIDRNLDNPRGGWSADRRRRNVDIVKGAISSAFVEGDISEIAFGKRRELDVVNTLRRSTVETPRFELKQGVLRLDDSRARDENIFEKVMKTACAIANISPKTDGAIFVGVADKESDARRIEALDKISPVEVSGRWIVGIDRECRKMGISPEEYFQEWRNQIKNGNLSSDLKSAILKKMDMCPIRGVNLLMIFIPGQLDVSYYDEKVFVRNGDETCEASSAVSVAVAKSFANK